MRVCLFDIDGTLIHTGGAGLRALREAMQTVFNCDAAETQVVTTGRTDRAIVQELFQQHDIEPSDANWSVYLSAYLEILPQTLAACSGRVLSGIPELLQHLGQRDDVAVGLLTGNSHQGAQHKLLHYQINHHFTFGGFGDEHTDRNDVARIALREVHLQFDGQIAEEQIYVIGDTPSDVRCARAIGARAVAVATGSHSVEELLECSPDLLIKDFSDLNPMLQFLEQN